MSKPGSPILLFTDGAYFDHLPGRPGGWAAVTGDGTVWSGAATQASSVQMELVAIAQGLARTPVGATVSLYTDCTSAIYHINRLRQGRTFTRPDPIDQQLLALLQARTVTLTYHPDANRHPSHLAAHNAARSAAQTEGGVPIQDLYNRCQNLTHRILLRKGGTVTTAFTYHDLVRAAPSLYVEVRRSEAPRLQGIFAPGWNDIVTYLRSIGGIPYCLTAAFLASNGAATAPPPDSPIALAPDFRAYAPGDLEQALAVVARHGLCLSAIQQQLQLREKVCSLAKLPGWSRKGELTYACEFGRHGYGGYAIIQINLASKSAVPGPLFIKVNATHLPVQVWSLSLHRRVVTALRKVGLKLQAEGISVLPAPQFSAALSAAADAYWNEEAERALHKVDGQEQLRPDVQLHPGRNGFWIWQLPGTENGTFIPHQVQKRVLAAYRARLLSLAAHPDLVAAAGARPPRKQRPGLQLAQ